MCLFLEGESSSTSRKHHFSFSFFPFFLDEAGFVFFHISFFFLSVLELHAPTSLPPSDTCVSYKVDLQVFFFQSTWNPHAVCLFSLNSVLAPKALQSVSDNKPVELLPQRHTVKEAACLQLSSVAFVRCLRRDCSVYCRILTMWQTFDKHLHVMRHQEKCEGN